MNVRNQTLNEFLQTDNVVAHLTDLQAMNSVVELSTLDSISKSKRGIENQPSIKSKSCIRSIGILKEEQINCMQWTSNGNCRANKKNKCWVARTTEIHWYMKMVLPIILFGMWNRWEFIFHSPTFFSLVSCTFPHPPFAQINYRNNVLIIGKHVVIRGLHIFPAL